MDSSYWERRFIELGAFWMHDGNPRRPYVRLTSGLISNGYFNCGLLQSEHAHVFRSACESLLYLVRARVREVSPCRIIGAAEGGIALVNTLAAISGQKSAYARRAKKTDPLVFDGRFLVFFEEGERVLLAEDTVTTGKTLIELMQATTAANPTCRFAPFILAICNRSGKRLIETMRVFSLIERDMLAWKEGENPFTPDGQELVPPVSAGKANWKLFTQEYA